MVEATLVLDKGLLKSESTADLTTEQDKINNKTWSRDGKTVTGKTQYPFGIFFILGSEFCERFSYYGMRAILVIYLIDWLKFSPDHATALFHFFVVLCYFTPIFGAILADGYIGKYRTILYLSMVYAIGNLIMATTAFPPPNAIGPIIGLILIGCGTGGIKPCVSAFGGDQFTSDQEKQQAQFFSIFYFAINLGSIFSMIITPLMRTYVQCFGNSCFPLAFGIPSFLMVLAVILFVLGQRVYKIYPPPGNVIGQSAFCIARAIRNKFRRNSGTRDHWLDYADDIYETKFLEEVKCVLRVFLLFAPLPIFWALFDQQSSRWIIQARQMDLSLFGGWHIPPDMIQVINPLLIIILIPIVESLCYPICAKCSLLQKPLQRMVLGMLFAVFAFILAGFLQISIDKSLDAGKISGSASIKFINGAPCPVNVISLWFNGSLGVKSSTEVFVTLPQNFTSKFEVVGTCPEMTGHSSASLAAETDADGGYVLLMNNEGQLHAKQFTYPTFKPEEGGALVSFVYLLPGDGQLSLYSPNGGHSYHFNLTTFSDSPFQEIETQMYDEVLVRMNESAAHALEDNLRVESGGVYSVILHLFQGKLRMTAFTDMTPNSLSVAWQFPQYIFITIGEVLFSISGLAFAYSQAPPSMKAVLQAGWLLTVSIGNLVTVIVAGSALLPSASEYFFFAALMTITTLIFAVMTYFYKYVKQERGFELQNEDDSRGLVPNYNSTRPAEPFGASGSDTPVDVDGDTQFQPT